VPSSKSMAGQSGSKPRSSGAIRFLVQLPIDGDLPAVLALIRARWPWAAPSGCAAISSPSGRFAGPGRCRGHAYIRGRHAK
jgi:hypothetical protein